MSLGPCGASDGGARTEQCRLGDLADCRGSSGCVLRRVLVELMFKHWFKRCSVWADSAQLMERALSKDRWIRWEMEGPTDDFG